MINNLVWNLPTATPDTGRELLIWYNKMHASKWGGNTGTFYTQGYVDLYLDRIVWFDYTSRLIMDTGSKKSSNAILAWAYIDSANLENI